MQARIQHAYMGTARERQDSCDDVPQHSETKQIRNAGTAMRCWESSDALGASKIDVWEVNPEPEDATRTLSMANLVVEAGTRWSVVTCSSLLEVERTLNG